MSHRDITVNITFCKKGENFEQMKLAEPISLANFKNQVYKKYELYAANFYYLDEDDVYCPIDSEKEFHKLLKKGGKSKGLKFYADVYGNLDQCEYTQSEKFDTRNIKFNYEFEDLRNDGKSRNTLENIKKEKSLIKNKLNKLCTNTRCNIKCPCDNNQNILTLENALQGYKNFQKNRLKKKFWKISKKSQFKIDIMV